MLAAVDLLFCKLWTLSATTTSTLITSCYTNNTIKLYKKLAALAWNMLYLKSTRRQPVTVDFQTRGKSSPSPSNDVPGCKSRVDKCL